jgi:flagellar protein FliS
MKNAGADFYREQEILTASPARLVAKLFEAAITSLRKAIQAIEDKDIEARWNANKRAIEIIYHLLATLDHEKGGEIAENLERIYNFILRHLVNVDFHNDPIPALEAIDLLHQLHRAWCELDQQLRAGEPTTSTAEGEMEAARVEPLGYGQDQQALEAPPGGRILATA